MMKNLSRNLQELQLWGIVSTKWKILLIITKRRWSWNLRISSTTTKSLIDKHPLSFNSSSTCLTRLIIWSHTTMSAITFSKSLEVGTKIEKKVTHSHQRNLLEEKNKQNHEFNQARDWMQEQSWGLRTTTMQSPLLIRLDSASYMRLMEKKHWSQRKNMLQGDMRKRWRSWGNSRSWRIRRYNLFKTRWLCKDKMN